MAEASPRGEDCTVHRDDRHTHPQRVTGRVVAVEGKRIEGDVNAIVQIQIIEAGAAPDYYKPLFTNAMAGQPLVVVAIFGAPEHQQLRARHCMQHASPGGDYLIGDLQRVIEDAKSDMTCGARGERPD